MVKEKRTSQDIKRRSQIIREDDIKQSDFEDDAGDNKKIIIVALILALLIGSFAYIRSLNNNKIDTQQEEKPSDEEDEDPADIDDNKDDNVEDNINTNNSTDNYQPVPAPNDNQNGEVTTTVNLWENLNSILKVIEVGSIFDLPVITVKDQGTEITANITYQFRANNNEVYQKIEKPDWSQTGEYLILYMFAFQDGKIESKEITITVIDTTEPIIRNVSEGAFYRDDVLLSIIEYSPYLVTLNGSVYDPMIPITEEGEYTLTVSENKESGLSTTVTFAIDKTAPIIEGANDGHFYSQDILINIIENNINEISLTKDNEILLFEEGMLLSEEGAYEITVSDQAGNTSNCIFTIDKKAPELSVVYTPNGFELTDNNVEVTITSNEALQEIEGWTLSSDQLILTKTFDANVEMLLNVQDLANNMTEMAIIIDYINYRVEYTPKLTIENLVANKVKATITSLKQLILDDPEGTWHEVFANGVYCYEKIYEESKLETINYEDVDGNVSSIEINIDITLNPLFVTYQQDSLTKDVTAYVLLEEEALSVPSNWALNESYEGQGYQYYKVYEENIDYEMVEFVTTSKYYVATITIDCIDKTAPVANVSVTYITEEEVKTSAIITIVAVEEIMPIVDWNLSEDKDTLVKIINIPTENVPTEEQQESVIITDLSGNQTVIDYTYNWN